MSADAVPFPVRFRGYDRDAVDQELHELHTALDFAKAERDRAVARVLVLENGDQPEGQVSDTVQWLIDTAEQDAQRIRTEAQQTAAEHVERAETFLNHRVELIEQAQHEADVCRAKAAEEARTIVHDALEKANNLLRSLRESETSLREIFDSGVLSRRMPPPRRSAEEGQPAFVAAQASQEPVAQQGIYEPTAPLSIQEVVAEQRADTIAPWQQPVPDHADGGRTPAGPPLDQQRS
jgi:cell division septum initiation protein DivIVA